MYFSYNIEGQEAEPRLETDKSRGARDLEGSIECRTFIALCPVDNLLTLVVMNKVRSQIFNGGYKVI